MSMSKTEAKQFLERLIFESDRPSDWVQDVWGLSPTLGEDAAKLVDVFDMLIECCSDEKLDNLVKSLYQEHMDL
jgi:hypothetical protein